MSDDLERRVRNALRAASLPAAPEALRTTMEEVASTPRARSRWREVMSAFAVAAAVVVAVVAIAGFGGFGRVTGPGPATPGTTTGPMDRTPGPAVTPGGSGGVDAVPSSVHVLTADELRAAIAAQRAGGLAPQVVVSGVDVVLLARRGGTPTVLECADPIGSCTEIGSLAGLGDIVTIRAEDFVVPPRSEPVNLRGPVAIRLDGTAPIEFLGHVDVAAGSGALDVPALQSATATSVAGRVVAVSGWLEGIHGGFSCGPMIPDSVPVPFRCQALGAFLSVDPVRPVTVSGNETTAAVPPSAVRVQFGAYESYASSPADDGTNDEPRHGLYLVRMVVATSPDCPDCRGWQMIGRLDIAPAVVAVSPLPDSARVRSPDELEALLGANRSAWVGKPVLVDGRVTPGTAAACTTGGTCDLGMLAGTSERVVATPYTVSLLGPDPGASMDGAMAFTVRQTGLEYLGRMGYMNGVDFNAKVSELQDPSSFASDPVTFIVTGWLVEEGPIPCPAPPSPFPPQDTPFETCPAAWLTQDEVQPVSSTPNSISVTDPAGSIRVQWGAYDTFAPDPAPTTDGSATQPRFGTYLVRLVTNTAIGPNGPRGWQVVGRLAP